MLSLAARRAGPRASNGAEAVALVASQRPDVVLMDVRMPVMDGLEGDPSDHR
jgi:CheY-like chemotaxis protein